MTRTECVVAFREEIIGDEAIRHAGQVLLFDHGVTTLDDFNIVAVVKARPAIVAVGGLGGKAGENVDLGKSQRRLPDTPRLPGNRGPQFGKQPALNLHHLFLRVEYLGFVFLQLRGSKRSALTNVCLRS